METESRKATSTDEGHIAPADSARCRACGALPHPFDVLCSHCGNIVMTEPSLQQLENAEKIAKIRSLNHQAAIGSAEKITWHKVAQPLVPVVVTLIVAIGGWIITSSYDRSQLALQVEQQKATRQTAEASASISYLQFVARDPAPSIQQRDQATMAAALVLPPELSFRLAIERLPEEGNILALLLRSYGNKSWKYISPEIEANLYELRPYFENGILKYTLPQVEVAAKTQDLLRFLDEQNVLESEFRYLISSENSRSHQRLSALVAYFTFLVGTGPEHDVPNRQAVTLVRRLNADQSVPNDVKFDLSAALSLAFPEYMSDQFDKVLPLAAERFWEGVDVSIGEMPRGLRYRLYNERFHYVEPVRQRVIAREEVTIVSRQLLQRLLGLRLKSMTTEEIGWLLYNYCESVPVISPYLLPQDCFQFVRSVLATLTTGPGRREFSMELGSLSGDELYRSIGRDADLKRKYAETVIEWYEKYSQKAWYIPKFLGEVEVDYPDLKPRIEAIFKKV
jgi:hypothetical protein